MSRDKQRLPDYLQHIVEAIDRIERYTANMDRAAFKANELVCDAVIRNVEVIGEASNSISKRYPDFIKTNPAVPWGESYEMRNSLAHGYSSIDLDIVWGTVRNDLPGLRSAVQALLGELEGNQPSSPRPRG
jgi:uncharacterized protein with HEPN domain